MRPAPALPSSIPTALGGEAGDASLLASSARGVGRSPTEKAPPVQSIPAPDPVLTQILTAPTPPPPALITNAPEPTNLATTAPPSELVAQAIAQATMVDEEEARPASQAPDVTVSPQVNDAAVPAALEPKRVAPSAQPTARTVEAPSNREDLLARLRERRASMKDDQIAAILRR